MPEDSISFTFLGKENLTARDVVACCIYGRHATCGALQQMAARWGGNLKPCKCPCHDVESCRVCGSIMTVIELCSHTVLVHGELPRMDEQWGELAYLIHQVHLCKPAREEVITIYDLAVGEGEDRDVAHLLSHFHLDVAAPAGPALICMHCHQAVSFNLTGGIPQAIRHLGEVHEIGIGGLFEND